MDCDDKTKSIWNIKDPYFSWQTLFLTSCQFNYGTHMSNHW